MQTAKPTSMPPLCERWLSILLTLRAWFVVRYKSLILIQYATALASDDSVDAAQPAQVTCSPRIINRTWQDFWTLHLVDF